MFIQGSLQPSRKSAEFGFLQLWVHNELNNRGHHYNAGPALIRRGTRSREEQGFKCERPENGQVYFLFSPSVDAIEDDLIAWNYSSGPPDEWTVASINRTNECLRCEVRRPRLTDRSVDELLRPAGLLQAAEYLANARQRLNEGTPSAWGDCTANCRNALQSAVRQLTGEGQLSAGLKKLKEVCRFGEREIEHIQVLDKLLTNSRDLLSKTGAHPPLPDHPFAVFALDLTTAILRFLVTNPR